MKLNWKLFAPLVVAILVWLIGAPEGLSANSWIYVSIFAGLVVGLILEPMPPAFIGIIAVTVSMLFKVGPAPIIDKATGVAKAITDAQAISWGLSGFSNAIVWLISMAFWIWTSVLVSTELVASSRIRIFGSARMALAIVRSCF